MEGLPKILYCPAWQNSGELLMANPKQTEEDRLLKQRLKNLFQKLNNYKKTTFSRRGGKRSQDPFFSIQIIRGR